MQRLKVVQWISWKSIHKEHFSTDRKNAEALRKITEANVKNATQAQRDTQKEVTAGPNLHDVLSRQRDEAICVRHSQSCKLKKKSPLGCVCTSCNKFESAPMTALQSSNVGLIRWLQSFGSQQHNAAEQAGGSPQPETLPTPTTRRPLSLKFPRENEMLILKTTLW